VKLSLSLLLLLPLQAWAGNTTVLFQASLPSIGPFPSNALTLPTSTQKTGLQVNLPTPMGCTLLSTSAQCVNTELLNQLDGFNVNPRITVCFSAAVNVSTLTAGISFIAADRIGLPISINQVIFDPAANCAYAKPSQVLDQDTQYLLVVTSAVTDTHGNGVTPSADYSNCVNTGDTTYCQALSQAVRSTLPFGIPGYTIAAASLFTTMSATSWMQKAWENLNSGAIPGVGTLAGPLSTFSLSNVTSIVWMPDAGVAGVNYNQAIPLNVLAGVDRISFGLYLSPLYLNTSGPLAGTINTTPTNAAIQPPNAVIPVSFHLFLPPASAARGGKIPVIIYGHGLGDSQFGAPTYAASTWAQKGFATLAIEITGHGYGPLSATQVKTTTGTSIIPTPGRGVQFSPTQPIGPTDGCILPTAIGTRDCSRQSAIDLFGLVRAIQSTGGLGLNLDPSRIYYTGQSFGSFYGTIFEAVEPGMSAATLNVGGGTQIDVARLSPTARALGSAYLSSFTPSLLNVPPAPSEAYFHDNFNDEYVYRGQVLTASVPGAIAIQAGFEQADWLSMLGDPLSYAGHLWAAPLPGVFPKSILVQFGLGDLEVPNPAESALVRAGWLQLSTWMLRTDLAAAIEPQLLSLTQPGVPYPIYPHRFLSNPTFFETSSPPLETAVGIAAQKQIADFFTYGVIPNPNQYFTGSFAGLTLFQIPLTLPDGLNFLQVQP
jgi:Bacterial Ig-like domain